MQAELLAARRDATLILTLSNPGAGNAIDPAIIAAGIETLSVGDRDPEIRAVVITGAAGAFCDDGALRPQAQAEAIVHLLDWLDAIRDCPKPVLAAVDGKAHGSGLMLALACDVIVAAQSSVFALHAPRDGLAPLGGVDWLLPKGVPHQLASDVLLGIGLPAPRLHAAGLVNQLAADGLALEAALARAEQLAALPPQAIARIKSMLRAA